MARRGRTATTTDGGWPSRAPAPTGTCLDGAGRGPPATRGTAAPTPGGALSAPMTTDGPPAPVPCHDVQLAPGAAPRCLSPPPPAAPPPAPGTRSTRPPAGWAGPPTAAGPPAAPRQPPASPSTPVWGRSSAAGRRSARLPWRPPEAPPPLSHAGPQAPPPGL